MNCKGREREACKVTVFKLPLLAKSHEGDKGDRQGISKSVTAISRVG